MPFSSCSRVRSHVCERVACLCVCVRASFFPPMDIQHTESMPFLHHHSYARFVVTTYEIETLHCKTKQGCYTIPWHVDVLLLTQIGQTPRSSKPDPYYVQAPPNMSAPGHISQLSVCKHLSRRYALSTALDSSLTKAQFLNPSC